MLSKDQIELAIATMREKYPQARTSLVADTDFHFLLAVILSAQATDKSVNLVTPALFARFPTPNDLAQVTAADVEPYIKTIGLYRNKARYLVACAQKLVTDYEGVVPAQRDELVKLPGVGRKTANVVLSERFGVPAFAVDTHVSRIAKRLQIVAADASVTQIERKFMDNLPPEKWLNAHHALIFWGRYWCTARQPHCATCPLLNICAYGQKQVK